MEPDMKREGKIARPDGKDRGTADASLDLSASVFSILEAMTASASPERGYDAAAAAAARGVNGIASMWRFERDDPVLMAAAGGEGSQLGEEQLAAMKEISQKMVSTSDCDGTEPQEKTQHTPSEALCFPVERFGEKWGALVVSPGERWSGTKDFLCSLAKAAGLVTERAALHDDVAHLRGKVAASENARDPMARYARLGQLAGRAYEEMAHIINVVDKTLGKNLRVPVKVELEEALVELRRAKAILHEQLELAQLEMPVLAMNSLSEIVRASVKGIEAEASRKNMRVLKRLDPMLSPLLLDSNKVRMAIDKVLASAIARSESEGWLKIECEADTDDARVQITWEEKGSPGAMTQDMFVPFGSLGKGGAGLAVASQIIREHGGGVCAKRFPSGTTALVITLPISDNQDRRRRKSRRSGLDRRLPRRVSE
jgi:hypothetical protein